MGGDLPATTNPFVEKWGYSREVVEKSFRFSPKNLGLLGVFAVAIPGFIYVTSKKDFDALSKKWNKPMKVTA